MQILLMQNLLHFYLLFLSSMYRIYINIIYKIYKETFFGNYYNKLMHFHISFFKYAVCPRSSDPYYIVIYNIKWVTTFWTYSISLSPVRGVQTEVYQYVFQTNHPSYRDTTAHGSYRTM